jgi:hypothetical protein
MAVVNSEAASTAVVVGIDRIQESYYDHPQASPVRRRQSSLSRVYAQAIAASYPATRLAGDGGNARSGAFTADRSQEKAWRRNRCRNA